jgi:Na+-translocating ferredoxin:NAD+ oxidoreductase RnfG subunit
MRIIKKTIVSSISLFVFLFVTPLEIIHNLWYKFVLRRNDIALTVGFVKEVYAVVLATVEEALKTLLPEAKEIKEELKVLTEEQKKTIEEKAEIKLDPELDKEFLFFIGSTNGQIVGYAVKDTVRGKWGPISYMLSLNTKGEIIDVIVLEYKEKRGRPIAKRRFLDQFIGKTINNNFKLRREIRAVSGATISSRSMTNGIKKLVYIFNEYYGDK